MPFLEDEPEKLLRAGELIEHLPCHAELLPGISQGWRPGLIKTVEEVDRDDDSVDSDFALEMNGGEFQDKVKYGQSVKLLARRGSDGGYRRVKDPVAWAIRDQVVRSTRRRISTEFV